MSGFWIVYLGGGLIAFFLIARCSGHKKVSSTFLEAACDPLLIIFAIFFWPVFFLNDVFRYIPMQRKERLASSGAELQAARTRRNLERQHLQRPHEIVGKTGTATTDLRFAGSVIVDGQKWNALSEQGFISAGSGIQVIDRQGDELRVRPLPKSPEVKTQS